MNRKRLTDILHNGNGDRLRESWNDAETAGDFAPLPAGTYTAEIVEGELFNSRTNDTPGYKLTFEVREHAEHNGRRFWHDLWLTDAALPMTKRDLAKLGVTTVDQLDQPIPQGIICAVRLALRRDDDGVEFNRVRKFDVLRIEPPEADAFAPEPTPDDDAEDEGGDVSFDAAQLEAEGGDA